MGRELDRKKNKLWLPNDTVRVFLWVYVVSDWFYFAQKFAICILYKAFFSLFLTVHNSFWL